MMILSCTSKYLIQQIINYKIYTGQTLLEWRIYQYHMFNIKKDLLKFKLTCLIIYA